MEWVAGCSWNPWPDQRGARKYLRETHPGLFRNDRQRSHFHHGMFHGFDFDATMLRIGAMNMTLHGVEDPEIAYRDSLAEDC